MSQHFKRLEAMKLSGTGFAPAWAFYTMDGITRINMDVGFLEQPGGSCKVPVMRVDVDEFFVQRASFDDEIVYTVQPEIAHTLNLSNSAIVTFVDGLPGNASSKTKMR